MSLLVRVWWCQDSRENDNVMLSRPNILWRCKRKDKNGSSKVKDEMRWQLFLKVKTSWDGWIYHIKGKLCIMKILLWFRVFATVWPRSFHLLNIITAKALQFIFQIISKWKHQKIDLYSGKDVCGLRIKTICGDLIFILFITWFSLNSSIYHFLI